MEKEHSNFEIPSGTKVLVTGATGFTGSLLVRKLVQAGVKVSAIARKTSNLKPLSDLKINWFRGDVYDPQIIESAVQGVEYIFHVAAAFREAKLGDEAYHLVHEKSTELLAKEALNQENFKRFIHVSTVGVHSHIDRPPADENYPFQPDDIYQRTKAEGEKWIYQFSKKSGLPLSIIRPCMIYGPNDKRMFKLFKMVWKGRVPMISHKNTLYHLIHVDDLTDFFIWCAVHPNALGEVIICGNKETTNLKNLSETIGEELQKKVRFFNIPKGPFFLLGDICEFVCKRIHVEPPIYRRRIAFFTKDRSFNVSKMLNQVNFTPKWDNSTGPKMTAKWYQENGWFK